MKIIIKENEVGTMKLNSSNSTEFYALREGLVTVKIVSAVRCPGKYVWHKEETMPHSQEGYYNPTESEKKVLSRYNANCGVADDVIVPAGGVLFCLNSGSDSTLGRFAVFSAEQIEIE